MRHRSAIAIVTIIAAGGVALALIPGAPRPEIATIDMATTGSASATLLKTLDDELAPPKTAPIAVPLKVAAIEPAPIAPAAALATPVAPISDVPLRDDRIGASAVNMRSGPSTNADTLSVLAADQPVQVGDTSNGWAQVTLEDGTTGWVYASYLGSAPPAAAAPTRTAIAQPRAVISGSAGDLEDRMAHVGSHLTAYARPLDSAQSVFTLEPGDEVRIAEVRGDWLRVETEDGMMAWIRRAR